MWHRDLNRLLFYIVKGIFLMCIPKPFFHRVSSAEAFPSITLSENKVCSFCYLAMCVSVHMYFLLPTCVQVDVFCVNVQVCPECVLYLSGQEITLFSRRRQWGHKGLWVIGNPDGCAWASWKKRLPQRSNRTHSTMLILFISVCAPFLFFYFSYSLPIFLMISSLIAWLWSPLF